MYVAPEKVKLVESMQSKVGNEFHIIYRCKNCADEKLIKYCNSISYE